MNERGEQRELEPIPLEVLREFLTSAAVPLGLWLGWQLQDPSSWLRLRIAELGDRAGELVELARTRWHARQIEDIIARVSDHAPGSSSSDETEREREEK